MRCPLRTAFKQSTKLSIITILPPSFGKALQFGLSINQHFHHLYQHMTIILKFGLKAPNILCIVFLIGHFTALLFHQIMMYLIFFTWAIEQLGKNLDSLMVIMMLTPDDQKYQSTIFMPRIQYD